MKIWSTKYALTIGIREHEVDEPSERHPRIVIIPGTEQPKTYAIALHIEGEEWHRTRERAICRAEKMRQNKLDSLNRQIAKLKKIKFE